MQFLQAFGVDGKMLLAQLLNFSILLFILYKIGYGPILKFVKDRTAKIEQGLKNADKAITDLQQANQEKEQLLRDARKEAMTIVDSAKKLAAEQSQTMLAKAKVDVAAVVLQGKNALQSEQQKMLQAAKADIVDLVIATTQKVLGKVVDTEIDKKWIQNKINAK